MSKPVRRRRRAELGFEPQGVADVPYPAAIGVEHLDFTASSGVDRVSVSGFPAYTAPCTFEIIFKTATAGEQVTLLCFNDSVNNQNENSGYLGWDGEGGAGSNDWFQWVGQNSTSFNLISELDATQLEDGVRHTLSVRITEPSADTFDVEVFLDGELKGSVTGLAESELPVVPNGGTIHIGDRQDFNNITDYVGDILEVRFWSDVRTDSEIANNWQRGDIDASAAGLQALYLMDDGKEGGTLVDELGNNDGQINEGNNVSWEQTPQEGPVPSFDYSFPGGTAEKDESADFSASASLDPDGTIQSYDWDFGDGTTLVDGGANPSHAYTADGDYTVRLTVTDDDGNTNFAEKTISVRTLVRTTSGLLAAHQAGVTGREFDAAEWTLFGDVDTTKTVNTEGALEIDAGGNAFYQTAEYDPVASRSEAFVVAEISVEQSISLGEWFGPVVFHTDDTVHLHQDYERDNDNNDSRVRIQETDVSNSVITSAPYTSVGQRVLQALYADGTVAEGYEHNGGNRQSLTLESLTSGKLGIRFVQNSVWNVWKWFAMTDKIITVNNLPTGWKIRVGGQEAVEDGTGTATLDILDLALPQNQLEVLDGSGNVQHIYDDTDVWGGDVFEY